MPNYEYKGRGEVAGTGSGFGRGEWVRAAVVRGMGLGRCFVYFAKALDFKICEISRPWHVASFAFASFPAKLRLGPLRHQNAFASDAGRREIVCVCPALHKCNKSTNFICVLLFAFTYRKKTLCKKDWQRIYWLKNVFLLKSNDLNYINSLLSLS